MKIYQVVASAGAVSLLAASAFALAVPASAAPPAGTTYVTAADIPQTSATPTSGWTSTTQPLLTSSLAGLAVPAGSTLFYGLDTPISTATGSTLRNAGNNTAVFADNGGFVYPGFVVYRDATLTSPIYFLAANPGAAGFTDPNAQWYATEQVGGIPFFTNTTLSAFDTQLSTSPALADAVLHTVDISTAGAITLTSFTAAGNISYFTPTPVSTAPASIGQTDFGTPGKGQTVTTTGFVPGETVSVYLSSTEAVSDPIDIVADADGAVSYTWVAPFTTMDVGTYAITFYTQFTSGLQQSFEFNVVAQAALAATGLDVTAPVIAGGMLLLGGAALASVATARRQRA